jgi:hypothetical protein
MTDQELIINLRQLIKFQCADEIEICKLCESVLSKKEIYGDSYGVPTIVDIVELLIAEIQHLRKIKNENLYF